MNRTAIIFLLSISTFAVAETNTTSTIEIYFEKIKNDPQKLSTFLAKMPKGADLHNHLSGSGMAENMLYYGRNDQLCIDPRTFTVSLNPACAMKNNLSSIKKGSPFYNAIIDAWSMQNFPKNQLGHDHFFDVFNKYETLADAHEDEIAGEVIERAALQNELYLELMITPEYMAVSKVGKKVGWNSNLIEMRKKLLRAGIESIVANISRQIHQREIAVNRKFHCNTQQTNLKISVFNGDGYSSPCHVKVRYLYQVLRENAPAEVFAQLLTGFILANQDPHFVGINMVEPEDGKLSMRDYKLHMKMVAFLHRLYPKARISLHAGELMPNLVPANGLRFHIYDAVEIAHANRIGHGVDISYETQRDKLLKKMAAEHIMVEINLTSNEKILGVTGNRHPLLLYMRYNVPVALSTDDEGVLRTNLTEEYKKATTTYHFSYPTLKNLSRNSITYSFLPGKSLWVDYQYHQVTPDCAGDSLGAESISKTCKNFLDANEKAQLQWNLETRFTQFEKQFSMSPIVQMKYHSNLEKIKCQS